MDIEHLPAFKFQKKAKLSKKMNKLLQNFCMNFKMLILKQLNYQLGKKYN